jgi:hypothetical protein
MAEKFKIRVEMRQIGSRQEASRLGGIGSCGRELCCSTWLTDFRSVSTSAARYQQLSLNPQKLAGQCGKLKCCLNYELDSYLDALKAFPAAETKLYTEKGTSFHVKTDVFKRLMFFTQEGGEFVALTPERVKEIMEMNARKEKPVSLKDFAKVEIVVVEPAYDNVVGQDSLNRFDNNFNKKKNKKPNRPTPNAQQTPVKAVKSEEDKTETTTPLVQDKQATTPQGDKPAFKKKKRRKPPRRDGENISQGPKTESNA